LPNQRAAEITAFQIGGTKYIATVGRFDDGNAGERERHVTRIKIPYYGIAKGARLLASASPHATLWIFADMLRRAGARNERPGREMAPPGGRTIELEKEEMGCKVERMKIAS
jgi:hypothetical protein